MLSIFFLSYVACYKYHIHMMICAVLLCFCAGLCWCFYSLSTFSGWNFCTQRQQVDQGEEERLMVLFSCKTYLNSLPLVSLFRFACLRQIMANSPFKQVQHQYFFCILCRGFMSFSVKCLCQVKYVQNKLYVIFTVVSWVY